MTSRMLARMCETGRLRAFESAYLMERATAAGAQAAGAQLSAARADSTVERPRRSARRAASCAPSTARPTGSPGRRRRVPAMSNAVPWSGLVRTNGRPSVTLTPCSTPRYFTGIRPWSCVIATTRSNSPGWPGALRARMNTVSGANGPLRVDALGARRRDRRRDDAHLLVAEQAALAGMRVEAGDRDARAGWPQRGARRVRDADRRRARASKVTASIAWRSDMWIVTSTVRSSSLASIMRTGGSAPPRRRAPAASRCGRDRRRRRRPAPPCGSAR